MRISNAYGLGCNILQVGHLFNNGWGREIPPKDLLKKVTKRIKNSYANVLMFNIATEEAHQNEEINKLINAFPVLVKQSIPSSMGKYDTTLFILDVSGVKKNPAYERYGTKFEGLDGVSY